MRCGTARHGTARHGAVRCGAVRCGAVRCGAVRCGAVYLSLSSISFAAEQKWSLTGVQLEEFHQAASVRAIRLQDVERDLKAANAGKQEACQAIAAWEKSIPPDMVSEMRR